MKKEVYLAGGCFWGVQAYFSLINGVDVTEVGYAQGDASIIPTYELVCTGKTKYTETVKVIFDDEIIKYTELLTYFFNIINPTSLNKQGGDIGTQYRTGIYSNDVQLLEDANKFITAEQSRYNNPIVVEVSKLTNYYKAETYHQDYLVKNPGGYCHVDLSKFKHITKK